MNYGLQLKYSQEKKVIHDNIYLTNKIMEVKFKQIFLIINTRKNSIFDILNDTYPFNLQD